MSSRILILPVEIKARELKAKLLLGALAVARGYRVYIGRAGELTAMAKFLPPGIFLEKDIAAARAGQFDALARRGHALVAWDDEGIVELNYDWYVRYRVTERTLSQVHRLFCWGEEQAAAIHRHFPNHVERVLAIGNPRIDLLRPDFAAVNAAEAAAYKAKFGDYILVNTNFGGINIFDLDPENFIKLVSQRTGFGPDEEEFFRQSILFSGRIFEAFKVMLGRLAGRFPSVPIILRPHPSENHDVWRELAMPYPNVHIIYEGTAVGWIQGAKVLIHNGCTTGLEGVVMGCPVIAYRPVTDDSYELKLPNDISMQATSLEHLLARVAEYVETGPSVPSVPTYPSMLHHHISNLTGSLASVRILDEIDGVAVNSAPYQPWRQLPVFRAKMVLADMYNVGHALLTRIRRGNGEILRPYLFRDGDLAEMRGLLDQLRRANPLVPAVEVKELFPHCYLLTPQHTV